MKTQNQVNTDDKYPKSLFWTAYSDLNRIEGIQKAETCITTHGFISDFKLFSDLAISLCIETEAAKVAELYNKLSVDFSMDPFTAFHTASKANTQIFLNISFSRGSGNMTNVVPEVPG